MKSIQLISLLFVCCLSLSTSAQTYFGIKMGGHLASFNVDEETGLDLNLSSKFGANFGIYMEIPLSGAFAIQPEISYISKGSSVEDIFFGGSSEKATIVFNNLDIHLLGKYTFGDEEFKAFITAGPTYGYTLKGFTKFGDEKENFDFDESDGLRRTEFGFNIGGGVAFPIDFGEITMDVRYLLGLSNINDDDDDGSVKNKGFGINIGLRFPLNE